MNDEAILGVFERGDVSKSAQDVASALGMKKATPQLRRTLERLALKGRISREVRNVYDRVYNRAFGGYVACQRNRAYYWVA